MTRPKRYALAIELTSHCNQKCSYCYNDWRDDGGKGTGALPTRELLSLVDRALTDVDFDHVTLTGGEPFARNDLFEVLDVCKRHGVGVQMISNGGVVTDALAARLAAFKIRFVQVTLNGPDKVLHEAHVGEGHWEKTLEGIGHLQRHHVPVVGCVVVTRKNAHRLGETLDLFKTLGISVVALSRYSPAGYAAKFVAELLPSRSEMVAALEAAELRAQGAGMSLQVTMPIPQCVIEHADYPHIRFGGCPIGTEMQEFALGPKGELRNCTLHTDVVGGGEVASFADLVTSPTVTAYRDVTPEFCAPCPYRKSCLGGCGAAAVSTLGRRDVDPFVAQHVDDDFRAALRTSRAEGGAFLPVEALRRRRTDAAKTPHSSAPES